MKRFGQVLRDERIKHGLTLEGVARSCQTVKSYVCSIESGDVNPPAANMTRRLSRKLGLDPDDMVVLGWFEKRPEGITVDDVVRVAGKFSQ